MKLNKDKNYIVSGLERSGTSMLMQMLNAASLDIEYDSRSRPSDENNPRGYYELEGGKIINRLMDGSFPFERFKGIFIKITSYGLKFLPPGDYKIIYSERNIDEIMDSMQRMTGKKDSKRDKTKTAFINLNEMIKKQIKARSDVDVIFVNYNNILENSDDDIGKIKDFLDMSDDAVVQMKKAVDSRLYRQRRK